MFKYIAIVFIGAIVYMIISGNMGGASKASTNYQHIMRSTK